MRDLWVRKARDAARALSRRFGVTAPAHINIEAFAARLGATVTVGPLEGAIAQLVRVGSDAHIIVSERITDACAVRFSIAHELGHLVLGHPSRPPSELCGGVRGRDRLAPSDERNLELEANAFAGELLMPSHLVQRWCEVSPVSMEIPWRIAREYNVSILASAIQFTALASERCAAVFSARREVVWSAVSPTFDRDIPRGKRIDPESVAWDFFAKGTLDDRAQPVPADAWLDTSAEVDIVEHSIASPQHGTVLSLLWIPERSAAQLF